MKKIFAFAVMMLFGASMAFAGQWVRINQLGYLPQSIKVAVFISEEPVNLSKFQLIDAKTGKKVKTIKNVQQTPDAINKNDLLLVVFSSPPF